MRLMILSGPFPELKEMEPGARKKAVEYAWSKARADRRLLVPQLAMSLAIVGLIFGVMVVPQFIRIYYIMQGETWDPPTGDWVNDWRWWSFFFVYTLVVALVWCEVVVRRVRPYVREYLTTGA